MMQMAHLQVSGFSAHPQFTLWLCAQVHFSQHSTGLLQAEYVWLCDWLAQNCPWYMSVYPTMDWIPHPARFPFLGKD